MVNITEMLLQGKTVNEVRKAIREVKKDGRKKYILVVDVESTTPNGKQKEMQQGKNLVYDVGIAITDKKGNIYAEASFLIAEIWNDKTLMKSAYYAEKIPRYEEGLKNGLHTIQDFKVARDLIRYLFDSFKVSQVSAYNLKFDLGALNFTSYYLTGSFNTTFFTFTQRKNIKKVDIWTLACKSLFIQKGFPDFCIENNFLSPAGNYRTNAEVAYAYLTRTPDFIEEHTGLADVKIEIAIMTHSYRQNKKIGCSYEFQPWRLANNYIKYNRKGW